MNGENDRDRDREWMADVAKKGFPPQYDLAVRDAAVPATTPDAGDVASNRAAAGTNELPRVPNPIPNIPPPSARPRDAFIPLQEWEGLVLEVRTDGDFVARLSDVTRRDQRIDEEVEFPATEVNEDDRPLVVTGAIFRWTVGFLRSPAGTRRRTSQVVFRRLPQWTKDDLARADKHADDLSDYFARGKSEP